jgi:hypothetical protein
MKNVAQFLLLMRSVVCSGATLIYNLTIYYVPMVRFMRQAALIYNLTIYHVQLIYYLVI